MNGGSRSVATASDAVGKDGSPSRPRSGIPSPSKGEGQGEGNVVVPRADIATFVHLGEQISHYEAVERKYAGIKMPKSIEQHAKLIDEKLTDITICDPAVGSGAFPVGMMTEIVRARCALTPYFNDSHERTPYRFKHDAIQNCIYGVDIDAGAVQIAKLCLWLSLVVDEEETKQVKPLPNLYFKIVSGNSLLGVEKSELENWKAVRRLEELKPLYFDEADSKRKHAYKREIDELLHQLTDGNATFAFEIYFSEVFHRKGGFDVTIGNPPYVRADADGYAELREAILDSDRYETLWEKWDLFVPFIERAYKLLRPGGVTTMIVSDAFCRSKYAQKPQKWFLANARVVRLDFCTDLQIFEAAVHNVIYFFQKANGAQNIPDRRVHRETFGNVTTLPSEVQPKLIWFPTLFTAARSVAPNQRSAARW